MITVESVEIIDEEIDVYDIEVETDHSFLICSVVLSNSLICIAYSGKRWSIEGVPLGHSLPMLPFPRHWGERSILVPRTKSFDELGGLPMKQFDNKTLDAHFRDELRAMGWDEERIAKAQMNVRASMSGDVPVETTIEQFFARQSKAFQRDQLGVGRFELYERGAFSDLRNLLDFDGNPLTVKQLRQRYGFV